MTHTITTNSSNPIHVKVSGISTETWWAVIILFFMFWAQNGWYRVDCALGIAKACELIASEKEYNK